MIRYTSGPEECQGPGSYSRHDIQNMILIAFTHGPLDQTPLPFEFLDDKTYGTKGSTHVQLKGSKAGWDKRLDDVVSEISFRK